MNLSKKQKLIKILRFISIYGPRRTLSKILGRTRISFSGLSVGDNLKKDILIVGCGQFGYSTIGYFINKNLGKRFLGCYDPNKTNNQSFHLTYKTTYSTNNYNELIELSNANCIYISSNHYTHTSYAIEAIEKGFNVYIEKPISVNHDQFYRLKETINKFKPNVYAGYNRPFSKAIIELKSYLLNEPDSKFSINCFISGHLIENDHWYRNKQEGTRVCGNLGHWIDLTIHLLNIRKVPDSMDITIAYSNRSEPDDNLSISITTDHEDLITLVLTSRTEPFEGINESINIQYGDVIAKIDDFRKMTIWRKEIKKTKYYWPKDVGHEKAILQPFRDENRQWSEIENSTLLMLFIKDMVLQQQSTNTFSFSSEWKKLTTTTNKESTTS